MAIDKTAAALAVPGVHRVYTWEDVPRKPRSPPRFIPITSSIPTTPTSSTTSCDSSVSAWWQCSPIRSERPRRVAAGWRSNTVLPAVFDPEQAMAAGAPQLHGFDDPFVQDPERNILLELHGEIGDVEAGFAEADVIHEGTYFSPRVQHAHLETHGSIAWMEAGELNVRTASQSPSICKVKLAHLFHLRPDQLRVFCMRVGGEFGGRPSAQSCYRRFYTSQRSQRTLSPRSWPFYSSIACTLPTRLISHLHFSLC